MYNIPEFHLETGVVAKQIKTEEELIEALDLLKEAKCPMFRIYAAEQSEYFNHKNFGTRREHTEYRQTLFEFLDERGFDITPWLTTQPEREV